MDYGENYENGIEQEILDELKHLSDSLTQMDEKIDKISKQNASAFVKFKRKVKKIAKQDHFIGHIVKRLLYIYRIFWRLLYCLFAKRKGIQNNKIVFISHKGKQYSCNPKYICEYLMKEYPGKFEIVWAFNDPKQFQYLQEKGITVVKNESKQHLRHLVTAKTIVTNVDFYTYLPQIKGQIALDTWHGGGSYKTCGFANVQNLGTMIQRNHFKRLYSKVNLYCSSSAAFTEQTIRQSRLFTGEVMEVGMPRNDILLDGKHPEIEAKVRDYFGLDADTRIVLYAPTYRSVAEAADLPEIDFDRLNAALAECFGGKWVCLFRQHHLGNIIHENILSATEYPDMQELLYTADILISDYSSCIWDFSLMYKPVFLFCPDLNTYTSARDFYTPIEEWGYILTRNQEELEDAVRNFDESSYRAGIMEHHRKLGCCESGMATKAICDRIYREAFPG